MRAAFAAALLSALWNAAAAAEPARPGIVTSLPEDPRAGCAGSRARLYAECADQRAVFAAARAQAAAEGKELLVSAGAEWCVWCHVLDATLKGFVDGAAALEDPSVVAAADALREATAARFVIVHIEMDRAPSGEALLREIDAWPAFEDWIPFVFGVGADGRFVARLGERDSQTGDYGPAAEAIPESQRAPVGYDRALLLRRIEALAAAVAAADAN